MALDPFDEAPSPQERAAQLDRWNKTRFRSRPTLPTQYPLMVALEGSFPSHFADKPVPTLPKKKKKAKEDPEDGWGEDEDEPKAGKKGAGEQGPDPAKAEAKSDAPKEVATKQAPSSAKLIVIGDATFVRDDFLRLLYGKPSTEHSIPLTGPCDKQAGAAPRAVLFVKNLFDWLSQESDLQELIFKKRTDRTMKFGEIDDARQETPDEFRERVTSSMSFSRWLNVLGPMLTLFAIGLGIWFVRRAKKRAFLASL